MPEWADKVTNKELLKSPALQGVKDINGLVQKVVEFNAQNPADAVQIPGENATPEQVNAFYEKLGRPKDIKDYNVDLEKDLPEGVKPDPKMKEWFLKNAFDLGLTQKQASELGSRWTGLIKDSVSEANQRAEAEASETMSYLKKEYGNALKSKMVQAQAVAREIGGPELEEVLNKTPVGSSKAVMNFLIKVGDMFSEKKMKSGGTNMPTVMAPQEAQAEINRIMAPGSPYWDKKHPQHSDQVNRVNMLYRVKNGEEV
jgi:hypothetical protein